MLRALLPIAFLVAPWATATADSPADPDAKAALQYWQAFAAFPRLTAAEEEHLNDECVTMPLDARARELVGNAHAVPDPDGTEIFEDTAAGAQAVLVVR
jgi:hypothetical protein